MTQQFCFFWLRHLAECVVVVDGVGEAVDERGCQGGWVVGGERGGECAAGKGGRGF